MYYYAAMYSLVPKLHMLHENVDNLDFITLFVYNLLISSGASKALRYHNVDKCIDFNRS